MSITEVREIDAIGTKNSELHLMISDHIDWEYEDVHLELLQDKINNYLMYIGNKEYKEKYGDDFEKIVINIFFKYNLTINCVDFLNVVSEKINPKNIFLNIHLPEMK